MFRQGLVTTVYAHLWACPTGRSMLDVVGGNVVSEDARNSIYLWIGGLAYFGVWWARLHYDVFKGVSDTWLLPLLGIIMVTNLVHTAWGFSKRRASNSDNPNQN